MPADPLKTHVVKPLAHTAPLIGCRFDPTGRFIFAGGERGRVSVERYPVTSGLWLTIIPMVIHVR